MFQPFNNSLFFNFWGGFLGLAKIWDVLWSFEDLMGFLKHTSQKTIFLGGMAGAKIRQKNLIPEFWGSFGRVSKPCFSKCQTLWVGATFPNRTIKPFNPSVSKALLKCRPMQAHPFLFFSRPLCGLGVCTAASDLYYEPCSRFDVSCGIFRSRRIFSFLIFCSLWMIQSMYDFVMRSG